MPTCRPRMKATRNIHVSFGPGTPTRRRSPPSCVPSVHNQQPSVHIEILHQVRPGDLEKFHAAYGTILKSSMTTLRKRDKKREKQRAEDAARKKRRLQEEILVEGSKRGAGRRKRQRKAKAAAKLDEAKKRAQEREETKARAKAS